ncbi:hypothetical protein AL485_16035 [Serratia liquefaciens]|uniref:response regulator transcription factor n=1 Tax=Serratia liquefaciens TaxID=614 RepID=UPI000A49F02F|nr:response regulator transcription factor [Serratia liquefaciens]AMH00557.2 hypothetical protein AL485_16035 [Serratia liquefaciens]
MNALNARQAPTAGAGRDVGGTGRRPASAVLATPHACVIDACAFARSGLTSLVAEQIVGAVLPLDCGAAYLQLSPAERARPVNVLVYRLPTALAPLLDAVSFLRRFLNQHAQSTEPGQRPWVRVFLLTDLPPFWLYDTLRSGLYQEEALLSVSVLPARSQPQQVRAVLMCALPGTQLVHLALKAPTVKRPRGLNAGEVSVLRHLLVEDITIAAQAKLKGISPKTLYSQRLSAMRKLGVRSLSGLFRWGVRVSEVQP